MWRTLPHTEKYFRNHIKSNWNQILFTVHRLIWNSKRTLSVCCSKCTRKKIPHCWKIPEINSHIIEKSLEKQIKSWKTLEKNSLILEKSSKKIPFSLKNLLQNCLLIFGLENAGASSCIILPAGGKDITKLMYAKPISFPGIKIHNVFFFFFLLRTIFVRQSKLAQTLFIYIIVNWPNF